MKPFIFMENEYRDLNSLGHAFAQNFTLAIEAIKTKEFLRFFKHFKVHRKQIRTIFYETRFLENALTCIIYEITDEHLLYVGNKAYEKLEDSFNDLYRDSFKLFIKEAGFSKTIINSLEDEKLKLNLKALEKNHEDPFAFKFISKYFDFDSIDDLSIYYTNVMDVEDSYQFLTRLLQNEDYLIQLGHKYDLEMVLQIRKDKGAFALCAEALKGELPEEVIVQTLEKAFYLRFYDCLEAYQYKGSEAKQVYKNLKLYRKIIKKLSHYDFNDYLKAHQDIYRSYLAFVNAFKQEKIKVKGDTMDYIVDIPYCTTYVWKVFVIDNNIKPDEEYKGFLLDFYCTYDLNKIEKSIKNHTHFGRWTIIFSLLNVIVLGVILTLIVLGIGASILLSAFLKIENIEETIEITSYENFNKISLIFIIGISSSIVSLLLGIFFLIKKWRAKKNYRSLCRLAYYRKNKDILTEKQLKDYDMIVLKEDKYVKTMDRFYRFYGGVSNAFLSVGTSISFLCLLNILSGVNQFHPLGIEAIFKILDLGLAAIFFEGKFYFVFIPAVFAVIFSFLRHKKTAWSCILTVLMSIGLTIAVIYIVQLM
ncbi:MAG: hypothetical protein K2I42_02095 [Anaeroplasmataceae bacterium]|nr:hypothetical protein [Anaeroplasmataceae bacterium]